MATDRTLQRRRERSATLKSPAFRPGIVRHAADLEGAILPMGGKLHRVFELLGDRNEPVVRGLPPLLLVDDDGNVVRSKPPDRVHLPDGTSPRLVAMEFEVTGRGFLKIRHGELLHDDGSTDFLTSTPRAGQQVEEVQDDDAGCLLLWDESEETPLCRTSGPCLPGHCVPIKIGHEWFCQCAH
jgi:hypothetical protein